MLTRLEMKFYDKLIKSVCPDLGPYPDKKRKPFLYLVKNTKNNNKEGISSKR